MEMVDIYNKNREKLGYTKTKTEPLDAHEFVAIAHIIIFNSAGDMLIQQRAADKVDWPDCWDVSCGGGAIAGETIQMCAEREAREELGLDLSLTEERPYLTIHYPRGFDDYYLIQCDLDITTLHIQKTELTDVAWAGYSTILSMMREGRFVRYNEGFIELLFAMKDNRGSYKG